MPLEITPTYWDAIKDRVVTLPIEFILSANRNGYKNIYYSLFVQFKLPLEQLGILLNDPRFKNKEMNEFILATYIDPESDNHRIMEIAASHNYQDVMDIIIDLNKSHQRKEADYYGLSTSAGYKFNAQNTEQYMPEVGDKNHFETLKYLAYRNGLFSKHVDDIKNNLDDIKNLLYPEKPSFPKQCLEKNITQKRDFVEKADSFARNHTFFKEINKIIIHNLSSVCLKDENDSLDAHILQENTSRTAHLDQSDSSNSDENAPDFW